MASLLATAVHRGPPPELGTAVVFKGRERKAPFRVQLLKGQRLVKEYGLSDPRWFDAERGKVSPGRVAEIIWDIRLPWENSKVDRLKIIDRSQHVWLDTPLRLRQ